MRKALLAAGAALALLGGSAQATVFTNHQSDITHDFVTDLNADTFADLDFTDLGVSFNQDGAAFLVTVTLNGDFDLNPDGSFVIGIDTGKGLHHPFDSVGEGNILFDQTLTVLKDGSAKLTTVKDDGSAGIPQALTATLAQKGFTIAVPLFALKSTGLDPQKFGFSAWSKNGAGKLADFVPNNQLVTAAGVPEPATWAMLVGGFAVIGGSVRRRRASNGRLLTV